MKKHLAHSFITICLLATAHAQLTSDALWKSYAATPDTHANIPNCSYAGYARGEKPLPEPAAAANVKELGAKGDGTTDDTAAFKAAIAKAAGKGAVLVPAGKYLLSSHLVLPSGTVLRGAGSATTTLEFSKPLNDTLGVLIDVGSSAWSWSGGLIWMGPPDTFGADGKVTRPNPERVQDWEYWRPGAALAQAAGPAKRGDSTIAVDKAAGLKPGQFVVMTWENPADASLLKHIAGHPSMEAYNWASATWLVPPQYPQFQWPVEIKAVSGNSVTLAQPLRVDIRPEWKVALHEPGGFVQEAGVEGLHLVMRAPREHKHLKCVGWNGILFNRAYNCWARDVQITGAENPVLFSAAKNCTATGLKIDGEQMNHHSVAMRVNTADCLVHDFSIAGMWRVKHGINVEWLTNGCVYSKGNMEKGTFDSHRALSFDIMRTEITLTNDADGPGGAGQAGPFIGARVAHWNVKVDASGQPGAGNANAPGDFVFMPLTFPNGAFVGIQGAPRSDKVRDTVPGEKGSVIADEGKVPAITNLYEAQRKLRLGK